MAHEILPNFYHIELPYFQSPLRTINVYVAKTDERALMIDTGVNLDECQRILMSGLKEIDIDLKKTDFFITHGHRDHIGLVPYLATRTSTVYSSRSDSVLSHDDNQEWQTRIAAGRRNGFSEKEVEYASRYRHYEGFSKDNLNFHLLSQDDVLAVGDFKFRCIETPGHSKNHMCLYEPNRKILLSGDHILWDITPNISTWRSDENPLADYLLSLDKVYNLEIELVLPGHREIFKNLKARIDEMREHHEIRTAEALSVVGRGSQNAYKIASQMTWNVSYRSWAQFPVMQKFSAVGETIAHLNFLVGKGKVRREMRGQEIVFSLS